MLQVNMKPCCRETAFFTFSLTLPGATSDKVEGWVVQWWGYSPPTNVVWVWIPDVMLHVSLLLVLAPCTRKFFTRHSSVPSPQKSNIPQFQFHQKYQAKSTVWMCHLWIIIYYFCLIYSYGIHVRKGKVCCPPPPPRPRFLALPVQSYSASNKPACCQREGRVDLK